MSLPQVAYTQGDIKPVFGSASAASGTLTIAGSPAPTFTLLDSSGAVVSGFNGIAVTGQDSTPAASMRVWYLLNSAALPMGVYLAQFVFSVTSSADGLTRAETVEVEITVGGATEGLFSFNPATNRGKVRLLVGDTLAAAFTFTDVEIDAFLAMKANNLYAAAALACETQGRGFNQLSEMIRASDGSQIRRRPASEWLLLAGALRESALNNTLQTGNISSGDTEFLDNFRPIWRDLEDVPVVE